MVIFHGVYSNFMAAAAAMKLTATQARGRRKARTIAGRLGD